MFYDGPAPEDAEITRTGGLPLLPAEVEWPRCTDCEGNMQFLARVQQGDLTTGESTDQRVLQLFMCDNDPGGCETWEPGSGANAVIVLPPGPAPVRPAPDDGVTTLPEVSSIRLEEFDVEPDGSKYWDPYDAARMTWMNIPGKRGRDIIGQLGGEPSWVYSDRHPACTECGEPLRFAVQLEEGHDSQTGANYGGGSALVFVCPTHDQGAFLWEQ